MQLTPAPAADAVRLTDGGSLSVATLRHRGCAAHRPRRFKEPATVARIGCILLIVAGILGLKVTSGH
jgi:hypothetical protein